MWTSFLCSVLFPSSVGMFRVIVVLQDQLAVFYVFLMKQILAGLKSKSNLFNLLLIVKAHELLYKQHQE